MDDGERRTASRREKGSVWLKLLMCQDIESQCVRLAVEILEKGIFENLVIAGSSHEQGYAGPEFQMVWIAEYLFSTVPVHVEDKLRTFSEPWSQDRVL